MKPDITEAQGLEVNRMGYYPDGPDLRVHLRTNLKSASNKLIPSDINNLNAIFVFLLSNDEFPTHSSVSK